MRRGGSSVAGWVAVILLVGTGLANLWISWTTPTPWALDCCFGPGDGQPAGLPVALIHTAVAAVVAIPRYAVLGALIGTGWAVLSAVAWAWLAAWLFLIKQAAFVSLPSRANGSWVELLIAPAMLLAYLVIVASLWTEARRAPASRGERLAAKAGN